MIKALSGIDWMNVRFQYKADIRVEGSERLLSSESGHSVKPFE